MGSFANKNVPGFDEAQLALYEDLLENNDPDLYNWITGKEAAPHLSCISSSRDRIRDQLNRYREAGVKRGPARGDGVRRV